MVMLSVTGLSVRAGLTGGEKNVVSNVTFNVADGERLGIIGASGAGKTMTALALIGLLPENCRAAGTASLDGEDLLSAPKKRLGELRGDVIVYIPQSGADFLNPSLTVGAHFNETLARLRVARSRRGGEAEKYLGAVGFAGVKSVLAKYPFQLSGGMAQRVLLALTLAAKPKLIIADEPTRGLDRDAADAFLRLMGRLLPDAAALIITHDRVIASRCDRVMELKAAYA
jgi:ABC-type glutathione transport system ATPase component